MHWPSKVCFLVRAAGICPLLHVWDYIIYVLCSTQHKVFALVVLSYSRCPNATPSLLPSPAGLASTHRLSFTSAWRNPLMISDQAVFCHNITPKLLIPFLQIIHLSLYSNTFWWLCELMTIWSSRLYHLDFRNYVLFGIKKVYGHKLLNGCQISPPPGIPDLEEILSPVGWTQCCAPDK